MGKYNYLEEIDGWQKLEELFGESYCRELDAQIEQCEYMPDEEFSELAAYGDIPRIYAVYTGLENMDDYLNF